MAVTFAGVKTLQSVGGGCIKAYWRHASSEFPIESYDVYIRPNNSDVFLSAYVWASLPYRSEGTSAILRTESDASTFLRNDITYYVGVRAKDITGLHDINTYIKAMKVVGDGSAPVEAPDRKIAKAV